MKNYLSALVMISLISGCSPSDEGTLKIIETSFDQEVPTTGNLVFIFNQGVATDEMLGKWDTVSYINFEPQIHGAYKWRSGDELIFSPLEELAPATDYQATLSKSLSRLKQGTGIDNTPLKFHTPYLQLQEARAYWKSESPGQEAEVHLDLNFNYDVNPEELFKLASFEVDGEDQSIQLITRNQSSSVTVLVPDVIMEDKVYSSKLIIGSGLKASNGKSATKNLFEELLEIQSPYRFSILNVNTTHDGTQGIIEIATTQQVSEIDIKSFIGITPKITYEIDIKSQSFTIVSEEFDVNHKYELIVRENLKGTLGGKLKFDFNQDISFGKLRPQIKFNDQKSVYLAGKGHRNLEVSIINVPKVKVKITKLYQNNILTFLRSSNYRYDYETGEYHYSYNYYEATNLGDVIWEEEIESSSLAGFGPNKILTMDFEDKVPDYQGLYILEVNASDKYYLKANKVINISDIGLIAKSGKTSVSVFANSLQSAQPIAGVEIAFIGTNNQAVGNVVTDSDGHARLDINEQSPEGFKISMVTAKMGDDFNFLAFDKTRVNTSRFEVGGKYMNPVGIEAFIYGDRDIYRPGEKINLTAILRDYEWQSPGEIPVKLKLITSSGKEYTTIRKTLNKYGSLETSISLPASSLTGSYLVQLFTSNDVLLSTKSIAVEEFVPDRIKVEAELDKEEFNIGETLKLNITATNFFGPPAANRNYEVDYSTKKLSFRSKVYSDYSFSLQGSDTYFDRDLRSGTTDSEGLADENFHIPTTYKDMGLLQSDIFVTVFDETGRPVNRRQSAKIYTQNTFYGIKNIVYYFRTNQPLNVPLIAVDKEDRALNNVKAEISLIKHEYKTVLTRSGSYFRYNSQKVEKLLEKTTITLNGTANHFTFTPETSGRYEIRITKPGVRSYVKQEFYVYGWGRTSNSSFQVNNEGQIDITLDQIKYEIGDVANVILKAPFSGRVLVTVENEDLLDHFYIDTDKRAASFQIKITREHVPNVYITATLFKPHEVSDIPLTVAHGFAPMIVEDLKSKINVEIDAVTNSRSRTKQTIKLKSEPNSAITVAVVDEGILQLTGYTTPDPFGFFYAKRALEVTSHDIYPYLFPEIASSSTGGDGMAMDKRVNPMTNKRIKLVAFWSGILETDNQGNAVYEIEIPQFSGNLRVMAVSYKDNKFGSLFSNIQVADPIVVSTALPRFFSPGDVVQVPVIVSNTTGSSTKAKVSIETSGPVTINGSEEQTINIPANQEKEAMFQVLANPAIGQSNIKITVDALGEEFINETDITIRPAAPLQKLNGSGIVKSGDTEKIIMGKGNNFIQSSLDNKLIVSKSPLVEFTDDLHYLVRYPYGCIEQTVSSAFPQLYFSDIANDLLKTDDEDANPAYNVQEAIKKISMMQLYNGGLVYWPGGGRETWWGSAYAAHFLVEAKKAGYEVNISMLNKLLDYLKNKLKDKKFITYYYNRNQNKKIVAKESIYSLYVLALAGRSQMSTMNYYKSNLHELSLDSKYLLAAAYYLAGDTRKYAQVLPAAFQGEESNSTFGGSFYSHVRDEALALNSLLEVDPDNQQVPIMAKHVSEALKNRRYLNTQERSFSFLAMGKIARKAAASDIQATINCEGKKVAEFDNRTITLNTEQLNGTNAEIIASGTGQLYYFWDAEGISADGTYTEEDSYLRIRKQFYDRYGRPIFDNKFKQNDLVVVRLSIQGLTNAYVENVVITDMLPGGFEIENPRISDVPGMDWISDRSSPEYQDIRDDRINLFVNVNNKESHYYYIVRAVSKGKFQMGPVGADAMYNGEYHSYHGAGVIEITGN